MNLRILAVVPLVLLAAACGRAVHPTAPSPGPACPASVTITADDNNKTVCVAVGGTVTVDLRDPTPIRWQPIESSGPALTTSTAAASAGSVAVFNAAQAGSSVITSARPNCPKPHTPTQVACHSIMAWTVTIEVKQS